MNGGVTNTMPLPSTDLSPHETPLIDIVTPLSSSGKLNCLLSEPKAVRGVIACGVPKVNSVSIPGDIPVTEAGVIGGLGVGVGVGVGEGCWVGVGVGPFV